MSPTQQTPPPGLPMCDSDSTVCWELSKLCCDTVEINLFAACFPLPRLYLVHDKDYLSPLLFACHHITWDCNSMRFHELWSWLGIGAEVLAKGTLKDSVLNTGSYWVSLSPVQSISLLSLQILPQSSLCNPKMRCPVASIASVSLSRDGCCISLTMKWSLCIVS